MRSVEGHVRAAREAVKDVAGHRCGDTTRYGRMLETPGFLAVDRAVREGQCPSKTLALSRGASGYCCCHGDHLLLVYEDAARFPEQGRQGSVGGTAA